jgi:hypothetical protein
MATSVTARARNLCGGRPVISKVEPNADIEIEYSSRSRWRLAKSAMRDELKQPIVWIHFAVVLSSPWWLMAAVYGLLRTLLVEPSGSFLWAGAIALSGLFLFSSANFLVRVCIFGRELKVAKERAKAGVSGAKEALTELRRRYRTYTGLRLFQHGTLAVFLAIPFCAALKLNQDFVPILAVRQHGKTIILTREQMLRQTLQQFEKRGIFKPLG